MVEDVWLKTVAVLISLPGLLIGGINCGNGDRTPGNQDANKSEITDRSGEQNAPDQSGKDSSSTAKFGSATLKGTTLHADWTTAVWVPEEHEVEIGFFPEKPSEDIIKKIRQENDLPGVSNPEYPVLVVSIEFEEEKEPSAASMNEVNMVFLKFKESQFSSQIRDQENLNIQFNGPIKKGGTVRGTLSGSESFDFRDQGFEYKWNLNFDCKIQS